MQSFFFFTYIICSEIHTQVMIQRKEWTQVFSESIDGELCQMLQSKLAHATSMQAYTANPELTCTENQAYVGQGGWKDKLWKQLSAIKVHSP